MLAIVEFSKVFEAEDFVVAMKLFLGFVFGGDIILDPTNL
jgi:hypothetical protein